MKLRIVIVERAGSRRRADFNILRLEDSDIENAAQTLATRDEGIPLQPSKLSQF